MLSMENRHSGENRRSAQVCVHVTEMISLFRKVSSIRCSQALAPRSLKVQRNFNCLELAVMRYSSHFNISKADAVESGKILIHIGLREDAVFSDVNHGPSFSVLQVKIGSVDNSTCVCWVFTESINS